MFNAFQFYDLSYSEEEASETSKTNQSEIDMIEKLIWKFITTLIKFGYSNSAKSDLQDISEKVDQNKFNKATQREQRTMARELKYRTQTKRVLN